jgi:hypothetical protein
MVSGEQQSLHHAALFSQRTRTQTVFCDLKLVRVQLSRSKFVGRVYSWPTERKRCARELCKQMVTLFGVIGDGSCFKCHRMGHFAIDCPESGGGRGYRERSRSPRRSPPRDRYRERSRDRDDRGARSDSRRDRSPPRDRGGDRYDRYSDRSPRR